ADLGGLLVAWDAFKLTPQGRGENASQGRDARESSVLNSLSPDQRFFYAYAQTWRTAQRPAQLRLQVQSNEHAPAKYRTNGPLADMPAFAHAFACKTDDAMVRPASQIVEIW
ncbi:MAG: peptidase, partial [Xanthomonadaceae bacterium]|nr:peptidase [Xanthomonadaceae bacterium]